ncbi:MAG: LuxR C-terminal-related transcriptional regulator [Pseudomonadota bacterium]
MRYFYDMITYALSPEDLSDLIGLVYDSAFEDRPWQSLLDRISQVFPGLGANVFAYEDEAVLPEYTRTGDKGFFSQITSVDLMDQGVLVPEYLNLPASDSLFIADAFRHMRDGFVARSKHFFDEDVWVKGELFKKMLAPGGFKHIIHLKIEHVGAKGVIMGFAIPADPGLEAKIHDPLFHILKLLSPHIVRASRLARAMALSKRATEAFGGFLDGIALPMLVTDENGRFLFGNAPGRRMLERSDPFRVAAEGRLALGEAHETEKLSRKIRQLTVNEAPNGLRVDTDEEPLSIVLVPFRPVLHQAGIIDRHLLDRELLCALFVGQSPDDVISGPLLEDVFDLTTREAEICKLLLKGHGAQDIADQFDRSPKTVRNQIQTIYEKVGVASHKGLMEALWVFRTVGTLFDEGDATTGMRKVPELSAGPVLGREQPK